jgi:hypothetical protein
MPIKVPNNLDLRNYNDAVAPYFDMLLQHQHEVDVLKKIADKIIASIGMLKGA